MRPVSRLLTAATLVAATLSVAACGSSSSGSSSTGPSPAGQASSGGGSTTGTLCSLTTKDEVSAVSGKPAADTPTGDTATGCMWQPASGTPDEKGQGEAKLQLDTRPDAAQALAAQAARGCAPTTPQVGDRSCLVAGKHNLLFAKGNKLFTVSCSTATDAALVRWAQAVAGRA